MLVLLLVLLLSSKLQVATPGVYRRSLHDWARIGEIAHGANIDMCSVHVAAVQDAFLWRRPFTALRSRRCFLPMVTTATERAAVAQSIPKDETAPARAASKIEGFFLC